MLPKKEELTPFAHDIKGGAIYFNKSERTIRRWLQKHKIYFPDVKYRPGKVSKEMAKEIRAMEHLPQAEIGKKYNISQAMVGRIINQINHKPDLSLSGSWKVNIS